MSDAVGHPAVSGGVLLDAIRAERRAQSLLHLRPAFLRRLPRYSSMTRL